MNSLRGGIKVMKNLAAKRRHERIQSILARHAIAIIIFISLYVAFYFATLVSIACFCWLNRGVDGIILLAGWFILPVLGAILISKHEGSLFSTVVRSAIFKHAANAIFLVLELVSLILRSIFSNMRS